MCCAAMAVAEDTACFRLEGIFSKVRRTFAACEAICAMMSLREEVRPGAFTGDADAAAIASESMVELLSEGLGQEGFLVCNR